MTKQHTDRTTIDLFASEHCIGRPKTNPLSRPDQLRINKRNQLKRDKQKGLRRAEVKLNATLLQQLNREAVRQGLNRSELIQQIVQQYFLHIGSTETN